jgi:hypothetical protein
MILWLCVISTALKANNGSPSSDGKFIFLVNGERGSAGNPVKDSMISSASEAVL